MYWGMLVVLGCLMTACASSPATEGPKADAARGDYIGAGLSSASQGNAPGRTPATLRR